MNGWISPCTKMPNIGDCIYVTDGYETHKIVVKSLPKEPWNSNVIGWKYAEEYERNNKNGKQ